MCVLVECAVYFDVHTLGRYLTYLHSTDRAEGGGDMPLYDYDDFPWISCALFMYLFMHASLTSMDE